MKSHDIKRTIFDGITFAYLAVVCLAVLMRPGDEQMMELGRNSTIFFGLLFIGLLLSVVADYKFRSRSLGAIGFASPEPDDRPVKPWWQSFWGWHLTILMFVTFAVGYQQTEFSFYDLTDSYGFEGATRLFQGIFSPNFDILPEAILKIIETVFIAFMATALALPLAFVLSFVCAKNVMRGRTGFAIYLSLRTVLNVTRSVEALIWAIIFSVWVGIGPFAGMLALWLHSVASLAKQFSEITENVSDGPIEGIRATGANFMQIIWFAIVPQVILPYVAFAIYRWDINVRMATIIGFVGGGGIGTMLIKYQGQALWPEVGCIIVVIAATVWLMDTASAYLREALK